MLVKRTDGIWRHVRYDTSQELFLPSKRTPFRWLALCLLRRKWMWLGVRDELSCCRSGREYQYNGRITRAQRTWQNVDWNWLRSWFRNDRARCRVAKCTYYYINLMAERNWWRRHYDSLLFLQSARVRIWIFVDFETRTITSCDVCKNRHFQVTDNERMMRRQTCH